MDTYCMGTRMGLCVYDCHWQWVFKSGLVLGYDIGHRSIRPFKSIFIT